MSPKEGSVEFLLTSALLLLLGALGLIMLLGVMVLVVVVLTALRARQIFVAVPVRQWVWCSHLPVYDIPLSRLTRFTLGIMFEAGHVDIRLRCGRIISRHTPKHAGNRKRVLLERARAGALLKRGQCQFRTTMPHRPRRRVIDELGYVRDWLLPKPA